MRLSNRLPGGMRSVVRTALLAAAVSVFIPSAQAAVIFNSLSGQHGYNHCYQCFDTSRTYPNNLLPAISELGDIIRFGGTARSLTSVVVGLDQTPYFDARTNPFTLPYTVDATLNLYTVDALLNTVMIASRTISGEQIAGNGLFDIAFDFSGVTVPGQIYYGLSFSNASNVAVDGLRFSLWDYYAVSQGGDGQSLPVGTDPGTVVNALNSVNTLVYGRMASNPTQLVSCTANGLGFNDLCRGFTPAVRFDAVAVASVAEPVSLALVIVGLVAGGLTTRRRRG